MMESKIVQNDLLEFVNSFKLSECLRDKSFMITGITGLIGSITAKCLTLLSRTHNLNIKIIGIVRDIDKAKNIFNGYNEIKFVNLSLNSLEELSEKVDYILHYACPTSSLDFIKKPIDVYNTIIQGTESVLKYAKKIQVKGVIYTSSIEVYGCIESQTAFVTEDVYGYVNPLRERSSYPLGKKAAEFICYSYYKQYSLPIKIARLTQTLGAGASLDDNRVVAQFAKKAVMNKDIIINSSGNTARPICYTIDAISAILYILIKGENGMVYNVANPDTYISIKEMAQFVKNEFAPDINIKFEYDNTKGYAPDTILNLDISRLSELGWVPLINLKQIYSRLIQYYNEII